MARSRLAAPLTGGCSRRFPRKETGRDKPSGAIPRSPALRRPIARAQGERAAGAGGDAHGTRGRTGAAQLDARRCAAHERAEIRWIPCRMERHLRAIRRARRRRPGPGHPRVGPERHEALERQCRGLLPVAAKELEATGLLLIVPDSRTESDDAGALLRRVLVGACHQVRFVHPRAFGAQRRRHERGEDVDRGRAARWRRTCARGTCWARSSPATCEPCRARNTTGARQLWRPLVSLRGDGLRQHVHRQPI